MATLEHFLGEIGAGSLSSIIEWPLKDAAADQQSHGPADQIHQRIQQEVQRNDDKTLALLKDRWDDFSQQLKRGDQLVHQLKDEEHELASLENEMDGPDAFLPGLVSHLENQQALAAAHLLTTTSVALLSALLAFNTTVATLSDATGSGDLVAAVQAQRAVTRAVEVGADEWIEDTDVWKSLIRWAAEEESRLEAALQGAVESCFQVQPASTANGRVARLTLCERVPAAPNGPEIPVEALLRGLEDLAVITGRKDQSDAILVRVAKQLLRHFIAPFLEANGPPRSAGASKPRLDFVVSSDPSRAGEHSMSLQTAEGDGAEAIEGLSVFLDFVTKRSSLFPTSPSDITNKHAAVFTAHLTPSLQSHVISSHLTPSLPISIESLDEYMATLATANAFESDFLAAHHLFAFLPPSLRREGREVEEQRVIRSWATRVPHHWARHVGDAALARVRTSVKSWDWGAGEMVEVEVKEEEEMLGLLLGLGLVDPEDEAAVSAAAAGDPSQIDLRNQNETSSSTQQQHGPSFDGKRRLPRELALQTVPKSAKREMTVEEALRPKIRRTRTPSPPRRPDVVVPSAVPEEPERNEPETVEQEEAPASSAPQGTLRRGKLGAARIAPLEAPPHRSPSPPPPLSPPKQNDQASMPAETTSNPVVVEDGPSVADETVCSPAPTEEPVAPPPPSEDTIAPIKTQDVDPDEIIVPQPVEDEVFAPFEPPAATAAGIETTADTAPEEDVVRPHEYRAEVDDEIGDEVEDQREATPPTEATLDAAHSEAAEGVQDPTPEAVPASNSSHDEEQSYTPEDDVHVKEESVEPELPPVSQANDSLPLTSGPEADLEEAQPYEQPVAEADDVQAPPWTPSEREGEDTDAAEPNPEQAWQPVPIEITDFDEYDDLGGVEDVGSSYYDQGAPQPVVEEDASLLFAESADSVTEFAAVSSIEAAYEESAASMVPQQASPAPEPVSEIEQHAYVPFDDDPYADDSFADLAEEDYPAPTRDDSFSPPSQEESASVEVPSPSAQQSDDPYAPPRRDESRDQQMSPAAAHAPPLPPPIQPAPPSSSRYAPPPQANTAMPLPPPQTSSTASSMPPPPPRASNTYAPAAARSKPPKRRIVGLDESGNADVPPIPPQQTAEMARQPIATESPRAVIAPLRSAFTNLSRPTRSGTPPRQDGPIQNHIQQRFVSPPPSMLNPYVPMALPPTAASGSSYLPANDPLLADLLGGASSKAKSTTANYFSPDRYGSIARADPSPAPQVANFANASAAQQPPYGAYSAAQSPYGYAPPPQGGQQYGFPQYGAPPPQMQPAMRMRGGFSSDTIPEDAIVEDVDALRLRGGADLGDMDDDGNHSADDWGFGSDAIASGDVEEDAWGFDDDETSTPAPAPIPSSTKSGATPASPPAKTVSLANHESRQFASPERVHSSSLSNASNVSSATPSIIRSRPASLVYSPSLAPPPCESLDLAVAESAPTEDESEDFGDDAWGFDENEAADDAVADPSEAETAADEPTQPEGPHELDAAQRTGNDVGGVEPMPAPETAGEGVQDVPDVTATSEALPETDDWGFGVDEYTAPHHSEAIAAAPSAEVVDLLDSSSTSEDAGTREPLLTSPSQAFASSAHGEQASPDEPLLVDRSRSPIEKPSPQSPKVPAAPEPQVGESRLAPEEQPEDAWDLDPVAGEEPLAPAPEEDQARSRDETAAVAVSPTPVLPDSETERQGAFSPAEDVTATPFEEPAEGRRHNVSTEAMSMTAHESTREGVFDPEHADSDDLAGVAPPKPADLSSEAADDTVREPAAELSALNAPAEQLHDEFPDDATPPPVDTPLIAQPLPHSDNFQPGTVAGTQDSHLAAYASAQLEDAGLLVQDDQDATEDPWSLDDNEIGESAESTSAPPEDNLAAVDSFAGDRAEAERLESDLPLEESFLDPQAAHLEPSLLHDFDDFADFDSSERVQQAPQPAWEPFEEPSGQPESTPTSADGYDRRAEQGRDGFSAEPSDVPEVLRRSSIEDVEFVAASSRHDPSETEASPSTSGEGSGVMVREAEMSSPEMVGGNGEWEGQPGPAGAEILDLEEGPREGAQHAERDSVVQHEELRPTPHDESAVQHESERLIVADKVIQPGVVLPAQDVHPQQRTFTPPLNALPQGDDAAEWDFDDDGNAGPEVLGEPAFEAEHAPLSIPDESTVQHIVDRSTTDACGPALPASTAQPQEHTFSLPMSAVPDPSGPIAAESPTLGETKQATLSPSQAASTLPQDDDAAEWTFEDDDANAGAEMLAEPAFEAELAPSSIPDEPTVQHIAERSTLDGAGPGLPASTAQPQEHTFSPPITTLPDPSASTDAGTFTSGETMHEPSSPSPSGQRALASSTSTHHADAAERDSDDNDANSGAEMLEEPAFEAELAPVPIPDESTVQHAIDRPAVEETELAQEPVPASLVQPQEHTFSPPVTAVPAPSPQRPRSGATEPPASTEASDGRSSPRRVSRVDSPRTSEENQATVTGDATLQQLSGVADSPGHMAERGEADIDDPWDLDPLEPEATVAEFAAEAVAPLATTTVPVARAGEFASPKEETSVRDSPDARADVPQAPAQASPVSLSPVVVERDSEETGPPVRTPALPGIDHPAEDHESAAGETSRAGADSELGGDGGDETWDWNDDDAEAPSPVPRVASPPAPTPMQPAEASSNPGPQDCLPAKEAVPSAPTVRRETMMVSRQSREIIEIAEQVLLEAFEVSSPSFRLPQFSAASEPLLRTFVSILSLYRATASVHNSNLLASVPAIAMQFANDAEWIGREADRVWRSIASDKAAKVPKSQVREIELAIQSTRQLGRDTRQKQISIQQAALMESLDEAGGFLGTSNENRYAACERALQQVIHTLQRLALVWKPIMTSTALYTTLGGLVNEVLLRVLDEIEEQTDISEEESIRLNKLSKMLHDLEGLFDGSETNVGREVPIWYKFSFLSELLEASMADFMFLFDNRFLLDFTPQELVRLLRALFADSPQRDAAVKRVLQGHPDAPADEDESS